MKTNIETEITENTDKEGKFWKVRLMIDGELAFAEIFETLSEARIWSIKKAKLSVSHFMFNDTDIVADITSHEFA